MIKKVNKAAPVATSKENYVYDIGSITSIGRIDNESISVDVKQRGKTSRFNFSFEIEPDAFCCGLFSVGNFRVTGVYANIPVKERIKLVRKAFEALADKAKENKKESALVFTLVNNAPCNLVKEALKDENLFAIVKTFININSGVENALYVSN